VIELAREDHQTCAMCPRRGSRLNVDVRYRASSRVGVRPGYGDGIHRRFGIADNVLLRGGCAIVGYLHGRTMIDVTDVERGAWGRRYVYGGGWARTRFRKWRWRAASARSLPICFVIGRARAVPRLYVR